ncbi:type II toxin-antitoxin system HicA family toxin [Tautonia marina]|uniref:type II toxin-antitoxin system HicA family toxin n=1 Tax=Tautonia marina TaxID=2653855 RepID=UPI0012610BDE|nr:type II toxin-antitoxin system HicA family toxin [Tautonia marina]
MARLSRKHRTTRDAVFETPTRGDLSWRAIEALLGALGAEITEGRGSRVRVHLNGVRAVFHRPHPEKEASKGTVEAVREFLIRAEESS